eukprot:gene3372-13405_t
MSGYKDVPSEASLLSSMPTMDVILNRYSTPEAYLKSMQLHSSAEYFLATQEGRMEAHLQGRSAWRKYTLQGKEGKKKFQVEGVDFEEEPWGKEGYIRCLGYVGSHIMEFSSAGRMLSKMPAPGSASRWLLEAVASPGTHPSIGTPPHVSTLLMGRKIIIHNDKVPVNQAQEHAVRHLRPGLDTIHGPPGTGKSTTIYHIVASRVKKGNKTLVTCTRNQAVNAVVDKVSGFGCVVYGNPKRLGIDALRYTLDALVERDPIAVIKAVRWSRLSACEQQRVTKWSALLSSVHKLFIKHTTRVEDLRRVRILINSRVFLSTVEATARMAMDIIKAFADRDDKEEEVQRGGSLLRRVPKKKSKAPSGPSGCPLKIDTCIIDEAGSVLESAVPVLLFWEPANLVLVMKEIAKPLSHARSLLERSVDAGMVPWFLATQYRMHPRLSGLVSRLFYNGRLVSAPPADLPRPHPRPCLWVERHGDEKKVLTGGYYNPMEATVVTEQAELVVASGLYPLTFVISFYNKQKETLPERFEARPILAQALQAGTLLILSVDACQGSEADCVIISPVRTLAVSSFGKSKHRLCVALSRAKHLCIIVGHHAVFQKKGGALWKQIASHFVNPNPDLHPAVSSSIGRNPSSDSRSSASASTATSTPAPGGSGSSARAPGAATATSRPAPGGSASSAGAAAASTATSRPAPGGSGSSARAAGADTATSRPVPGESGSSAGASTAMSRPAPGGSGSSARAAGADTATSRPDSGGSRVTSLSAEGLSMQVSMSTMLMRRLEELGIEAGGGFRHAGPSTSRPGPPGRGTRRPATTGPATSRPTTAGRGTSRPATTGPGTSHSGPPGPATSRPGTAGLSTSHSGPPGPVPSRPGTAGPATSRPATTGPGPSRPGPSGPGPSRIGTAGPANSQPGPPEPGPSRPATTGPGPSRPVTAGPGTSRPGTAGPANSQPGPPEPGPSRPATTGPGPSRPGTAGPCTSQPGPLGPVPSRAVTSSPATNRPGTAGPGPSRPSTTGPGTSGPATTGPGPSHPSTAGPGPSHPSTTGPGPSRPVTSGPGPSHPVTAVPGASRPATTGPGPSRSSTTGPVSSLPGPAGPGPSRPATTGPGSSLPGPAGPGTSGPVTPGPATNRAGPATNRYGKTGPGPRQSDRSTCHIS